MLFEGRSPILMDQVGAQVFTCYTLTSRWKSAGHLAYWRWGKCKQRCPLAMEKRGRLAPPAMGKV